MITNKDIRVENGFLIINGDKFPLDGQSPEAIMQIVEDNSDSTPTENSTAPVTSGGVYDAIGDISQTGVTGADVAAQVAQLNTDVTSEIVIENKTISVTGDGTSSYVSDVYDISKSGYKCLGFTSWSTSILEYLVNSAVITENSDDTATRILFASKNATPWPTTNTCAFNIMFIYKKIRT